MILFYFSNFNCSDHFFFSNRVFTEMDELIQMDIEVKLENTNVVKKRFEGCIRCLDLEAQRIDSLKR